MLARTALLALAIAAGDPASATPDALVGTEWRVDRLGGTRLAPQGERPTIRFEDTYAAGFSGCNEWRARAAGEDLALSFQDIMVAKRKCLGGLAAMEADFLRALARTQRAQRSGASLVLIDLQGRETMRLMR